MRWCVLCTPGRPARSVRRDHTTDIARNDAPNPAASGSYRCDIHCTAEAAASAPAMPAPPHPAAEADAASHDMAANTPTGCTRHSAPARASPAPSVVVRMPYLNDANTNAPSATNTRWGGPAPPPGGPPAPAPAAASTAGAARPARHTRSHARFPNRDMCSAFEYSRLLIRRASAACDAARNAATRTAGGPAVPKRDSAAAGAPRYPTWTTATMQHATASEAASET